MAGVSNASKPRVCVIGAGVSGLVTTKYLHQAGIPVDCVDERGSLGGIWSLPEKSGITSVWDGLVQNSPRGMYEFADFPMPDRYADYPTHGEVHEYLNDYVNHFGFRDRIMLSRRVTQVQQRLDGSWDVNLDPEDVRTYDAVVVANGHHNEPRFPDYKASFTGESLHSRDYRRRDRYRDKRVLIVGIGNSGSQIAVDVSHVAEQVYVSTRRGVYVMPYYHHGIRVDWWLAPATKWWIYRYIPWPLRGWIFSQYYRLLFGRPTRFGLPEPDHYFTAALPTVCNDLQRQVESGAVTLKPSVSRVQDQRITFADGSEEDVDEIIYCTGYETTFPFLDKNIFSAEENWVRLYKRMFLPGYPSLCFVGTFQAISFGFLPLYEKQAQMLERYFTGEYAMPSPEDMERDISLDVTAIRRQFVRTPRNHYQMNGYLYLHEIDTEMKQGQRRAAESDRVGTWREGSKPDS